MNLWRDIAGFLADDGLAALIRLNAVSGSSPRDAGAGMAVRRDGAFSGTIGGGALEWAALAEARHLIEGNQACSQTKRHILGPDLGQCCGGSVEVSIEVFVRDDRERIALLAQAADAEAVNTPVILFGAGHVGRALVMAMAPLPFQVTWVDARPDAFPSAVPANVTCVSKKNPKAALVDAPAGALVVVMTHSHALDLAIVAQALGAARFAYVGLIGSATKRARFLSQMRQAGLAEDALSRLVCPIGAGLRDKSPAVIAAATAVELLGCREKADPTAMRGAARTR